MSIYQKDTKQFYGISEIFKKKQKQNANGAPPDVQSMHEIIEKHATLEDFSIKGGQVEIKDHKESLKMRIKAVND